MFLKNRNIISQIRRSKVTDYAALRGNKNICGKFSKISNTFLFLYSNKMLVSRDGIHKMLVTIANSEDPDQTASSEAV